MKHWQNKIRSQALKLSTRCAFAMTILAMLSAPQVHAGEQPPERLKAAEIKVSYLFNFGKLVGWPKGYLKSDENTLDIGIFGNGKSSEEIYRVLKEDYSDKHVGGRTLRIRRVLEDETIPPLHILYINSENPETLKRVHQALLGQSVLTVSDSSDANVNPLGSMIYFFMNDEKISFCIESDRAQKAGIEISDYLARLGEKACKK